MYYVAKLTKENDGGYSVEFPDVPGCITQGDTMDEALAMAKDALELVLEEYLDGKPLPSPDTDEDHSKGLYRVYVDEKLAGKLLEKYKSSAIGVLEQLDSAGFFGR